MTKRQAKNLKYGDHVLVIVDGRVVDHGWFKAIDPKNPDMAVLATAPNMEYNIGAAISLLTKAS